MALISFTEERFIMAYVSNNEKDVGMGSGDWWPGGLGRNEFEAEAFLAIQPPVRDNMWSCGRWLLYVQPLIIFFFVRVAVWDR